MGTIQKRADELKPGDVVTLADMNGGKRAVILRPAVQEHYSGGIEAIYFMVAILDGALPVTKWGWGPEVELTVDAPSLTPAQQHAEELANVVRLFLNARLRGLQNSTEGTVAVERMKEVIEKIKPPEPPTLEEALALLQRGIGTALPGHEPGAYTKAVEEVLDRARRAGILDK